MRAAVWPCPCLPWRDQRRIPCQPLRTALERGPGCDRRWCSQEGGHCRRGWHLRCRRRRSPVCRGPGGCDEACLLGPNLQVRTRNACVCVSRLSLFMRVLFCIGWCISGEFSNSVDTERLAPVHCKICEHSKWLPQHEVSSQKRITSPLFTVSTLNPPHTGASKTTAKTFHAISFSTTPRFRCKHEKTKHLQGKFFMARRTNKGALYRNAHHRTLGDGYPPAPGSR